MVEPRWLSEREERAWRGLQLMYRRLDAELAHQLQQDSDLSHADYAVLVVLTDAEDGRLRLYRLAEILGWERSRLSHHLTRMESRGLVARRKCGEDRRGAYVSVTRRGRSAIAAAAPGHLAAVRRLFVDRLTSAQLDSLAEIAETVMDGLVEESIGAGDGG